MAIRSRLIKKYQVYQKEVLEDFLWVIRDSRGNLGPRFEAERASAMDDLLRRIARWEVLWLGQS